jgi:hypothetical protein
MAILAVLDPFLGLFWMFIKGPFWGPYKSQKGYPPTQVIHSQKRASKKPGFGFFQRPHFEGLLAKNTVYRYF